MSIAEAVKSSFRNLVSGERHALVEKKQQRGSRIMVSSNCQTGGVAAALQVLFPEHEVAATPLPSLTSAEAEMKLVEELKHADIWVSIGGHELLEKHGLANRVKLVRIPIIRFSGFHPDLVYARRISTNELINPHYNSAIAVWAYKNALSINDAEKLFNKKTFAELGYLTHWGGSIEQLKQRFKDSDLEFSEFILPMRREGLFMYSLNHPKAIALARLAKLIARKIGAPAEVLDRYIDINDGLNDVIWPVYPEIGDSLSLHSGYEWKTGEHEWVIGLRAFLEGAYKSYTDQKIASNDIIAVQVNEQLYSRVLGAQAGAL